MIWFITYSNDLYAETRDFSARMALKFGHVDKVIVYTPEDIDLYFRKKYSAILNLKTGNGLWLWKPYFVRKALDEVSDGDIVFYCDAGSFLFKSCKPLINSMKDDIWVSDIPLIEKQFTKPELFETMDCVGSEYSETNQIQGNFIAIRKTERGIRFADEWLLNCTYKDNLKQETICDIKNLDFVFIGHRSDQSVLSLLVKKWNIKPHLDPSQYGKLPEKYFTKERIFKIPEHDYEYKPCIILHRQKKPGFRTCFFAWICMWLPHSFAMILSKPAREYKKVRNKN